MRTAYGLLFIFIPLLAGFCSKNRQKAEPVNIQIRTDTVIKGTDTVYHIVTGHISPEQLVDYARTLLGVPYKYASADPAQGFDCSGFITYVFGHFGIAVPRRSVDFKNADREIPLGKSRPGDLILFTGTDSTIRVIGHMGIIVSIPGDSIRFIHASSGKANGVTITPLNSYYQGRFVKTVRVFEQNDHTGNQ